MYYIDVCTRHRVHFLQTRPHHYVHRARARAPALLSFLHHHLSMVTCPNFYLILLGTTSFTIRYDNDNDTHAHIIIHTKQYIIILFEPISGKLSGRGVGGSDGSGAKRKRTTTVLPCANVAVLRGV